MFQVRYLGGTSGTSGTVIGTYKTSANGSFTVTGLEAGTYVVEELASPNGPCHRHRTPDRIYFRRGTGCGADVLRQLSQGKPA